MTLNNLNNLDTPLNHGLILFAHGSRDGAWALPFEAMLAHIQAASPKLPCGLAYLELMQPDFATQVANLVAQGVQHIRVLPVFLAMGKHLRLDLPELITVAMATHQAVGIAGLQFEVLPVAGESPVLRQAIVALALENT